MFFDSYQYVLFLAIVLVLYHVTKHRGQNLMLLVASYLFYGFWDWRFLSLIVLSTVVDYFCALEIDREGADGTRRKRFLLLSCVVNLGLLGFFKYYGFFATELNGLLGSVGLGMRLKVLKIILPVGISFYTFQTMSYTIDVYRRQTKPIHDILDFALYVSFFPQLVAGPIERSHRLIPQIVKERSVNADAVSQGLYLLLLGFFKKIAIADNAAVVADTVFHTPVDELSALNALVGTYAFAVQIYCDFSGYSAIARGTAKLLGFDLMVNFNLPYFATSPRYLWHRWHISLSSWLRDYLYVPLGGGKKGPARTYLNLALTMLLGGLWHGAAWTFIVWGAFHGLLLAIWRRFFRDDEDNALCVSGVFKVLVTFHLVCVSWVLFRAESLPQAWGILASFGRNWTIGPHTVAMFALLAFYSVPLFGFELWLYKRNDLLALTKSHWAFRAALYLFMLIMIIFFGPPMRHEFIYFQF